MTKRSMRQMYLDMLEGIEPDYLLQYSYGNLHNESLVDIMQRIKQSETYKRAEYIAQSGC